MKVSVIVTVYNRFDSTRNILKCLIKQNTQPYEVIFADDGSSQDILEVIDDLLPQCRFKVKHIFQEDIGFRLSRSRNNAARIAEGEYFIFLDQDLVFSENFISSVLAQRKERSVLYGYGLNSSENEMREIEAMLDRDEPFQKMKEVISKEEQAHNSKRFRKDLLNNLLFRLKLRANRGAKMIGMCFALDREEFLKLDGFDENYRGWGNEDDDFCNRVYAAGMIVYPLKEKIIHMYHPVASTKRESLNQKYYEIRKKEIFSGKTEFKNGYRKSADSDAPTVKILN